MRKAEIEVYEFKELKEVVQEKVLDKHRDMLVDGDYWYDGDCWLKNATSEVEAFDLQRGRYLQLKNIVITDQERFRKNLRIPKSLWDALDYSFINTHCEANTCIIFKKDGDEEFTSTQQDIIDEAVDLFDDMVESALCDLAGQYEYCTSDAAIKEHFKMNEYEFMADGTVFYWDV